MKNPIGERIRALRKGRGWGQELLAEKMNVVQSLIAKVEGGSRKITVEEVVKLAELFETSTDYILRGIKPNFVNVSNDLGLDDDAISNLRNLQGLVREKGKSNNNRLDNQDVANFLLSYDGWPIMDTICEFFNTPADAMVTVPLNAPKEGETPWYVVNVRLLVLAKLQDVLSQVHNRVNRRNNHANQNQ